MRLSVFDEGCLILGIGRSMGGRGRLFLMCFLRCVQVGIWRSGLVAEADPTFSLSFSMFRPLAFSIESIAPSSPSKQKNVLGFETHVQNVIHNLFSKWDAMSDDPTLAKNGFDILDCKHHGYQQ